MANNLAWVLAAHPDASIRDADEAVRIATHVSTSRKHRDPNYLSTLAVALASRGDFGAAVARLDEGLAILAKLKPSKGVTALTKSLQQRRVLFSQKRPFIDPSLR